MARRDRRASAAVTDDLSPPDPFNDIRAPSLRLIRGGGTASFDPVERDPHGGFQATLLLAPDARSDDEPEAPDAVADVEPDERAPDSSFIDVDPLEPEWHDEAEPSASAPASVAERAAPGRPRQSSAMTEMRRAVALGLVLAAAIVALALVLRPAPAETSDLPSPGLSPTALGSGPVPDLTTAADVPSTSVADASVRLRFGTDAPAGQGETFAEAARAAGYQTVSLQEMPIPVSRSRIEFFSGADRQAAEALAEALAPIAGGTMEMRDLSTMAGSAEPGRIEAWIGATP